MSKQFRFLFLVSTVLLGLFLHVGGCSNPLSKKDKDSPFGAAYEMPDFETEDGRRKLVGDCAIIWNYDMVPVLGYGLVVGLPDTGGEDINSPVYQMVYEDMSRKGVQNIRAHLARPDTAVVEIMGFMRPGIQSGDRFDIQVALPENSNTKSLRGGTLLETRLAERVLTDDAGVRTSNTRALAAGPIMVDDVLATETSNPDRLKKGTILSGAFTYDSGRALSLIMKKGSESLIMTSRIANAINQRFPLPTGFQKGVASAQTDAQIILNVHRSYANDVPRYVRVIQSIACYETSAQLAKRIERLGEEVFNRETSQHAAFQLEAIGRQGIPALQQALRSSDMEIRFHAATSLAYLGDSTSARILAEIARIEPAFRVYALNALSVMHNDLEAETHLQELLHVPCEETRYGAFRALKSRNPMDQTIRGELLGGEWGQFSYHGINSPAPPMVHLTMQKHPEIVLFGTNIFVKQPFILDAGPLIFVNGQTPNEVVVRKIAISGINEQRIVSSRLDEIIRAVTELGGTYPDVVQLIRQADQRGILSCRLEIDRLPEPNRIYRRNNDSESDMEHVGEGKPRSFWDRINPRNIFAPNPGEKSSDFTGTVNSPSRN